MWQECEDAIMDDAMSMSNNSIGRVEEWLTQQNDNYAEPMERGNHGASDQTTKERLWRLAQRQANKDGRPRIPAQPSVKDPSYVSSQAAKRRGVSAEQRRNH